MPAESEPRISLADSIAALREQLEIAAHRQQTAKKAGDSRLVPPLRLTDITLEAEIVMARDEKLESKFACWIASVGGTQTDKHTQTQKVTIKLVPTESINTDTGFVEPLVLGSKSERHSVRDVT